MVWYSLQEELQTAFDKCGRAAATTLKKKEAIKPKGIRENTKKLESS